MKPVGNAGTAQHWDSAYEHGEATCSWFQERPSRSLAMFERAGITCEDSVIDVGGGAARLVDELVARGFCDLTVLDVSEVGLGHARARLGADAQRVAWLVADVRGWAPARTYRVWHDRAVFHFLTAEDDRRRYLHALHAATTPGAVAIFGCFALDGPSSCSGLPVARDDPAGIAERLGERWHLVADDREEHTTPSGVVQPFSWAALRRMN
jgi:SAM-dependent methyltransferase